MAEDAASGGGARRSPRSCAGCSSAPAPEPPLGIDADLRPEGRQGPLVRSLAAYERYYAALVEDLGGAGAAAGPVRLRRRRRWARGSSRWPTGCATRPAGSRPSRSPRSAGSRPGSTPSGCPAAPTRPPTRSSAGAGWPTSSGPCSCCSCGTGTRVPGLRTTRTLDALAAARDAGLVSTDGRRRAGAGLGAGLRGAQRADAGARAAQSTSCPGRAPSWPAWSRCSASPSRAVPRRVPAHRPPRPRGRRPVVRRLSPGQASHVMRPQADGHGRSISVSAAAFSTDSRCQRIGRVCPCATARTGRGSSAWNACPELPVSWIHRDASRLAMSTIMRMDGTASTSYPVAGVPAGRVDDGVAAGDSGRAVVEQPLDRPDAGLAERGVRSGQRVHVAPAPLAPGCRPAGRAAPSAASASAVARMSSRGLDRGRVARVPPRRSRVGQQRPHHLEPPVAAVGPVVGGQLVEGAREQVPPDRVEVRRAAGAESSRLLEVPVAQQVLRPGRRPVRRHRAAGPASARGRSRCGCRTASAACRPASSRARAAIASAIRSMMRWLRYPYAQSLVSRCGYCGPITAWLAVTM